MASGSNSTRDAGEETEEPVISMVDYLKEEEELENDAHAVLGGSDEHHCTYPMVINYVFSVSMKFGQYSNRSNIRTFII